MAFAIFVLLNAALFVRPGELIESLSDVPFYNISVYLCVLTSIGSLTKVLTDRKFMTDATTLCMLGVFATVFLSNLARLDFWSTRMETFNYLRVVLYWLLLIANLNSPARIRKFLTWLMIFALILTTTALLHHFKIIHIAAIKPVERSMGGDQVLVQLCATGLYNDPNDFCMLLATAILICLYRFFDTRVGCTRVIWLAPMAVFFFALILTRSRGGLLSLLAALMTLMVSRFGWRRAIILGGMTLPVMVLMIGGRSTNFSEESGGEDTFTSRVEFWREGFMLLVRSPVFGIGVGQFQEAVGYVAHNSFVHTSTELGLIGGACFLGVFYLPFWSLQRLQPPRVEIRDPDLRRLRPYLVGMLAVAMVSMLSISRCYIVPTYVAPGVAVAFLNLVDREIPDATPRVTGTVVKRLTLVYLAMLIATYAIVRGTLG